MRRAYEGLGDAEFESLKASALEKGEPSARPGASSRATLWPHPGQGCIHTGQPVLTFRYLSPPHKSWPCARVYAKGFSMDDSLRKVDCQGDKAGVAELIDGQLGY